MPTTRYEAPIRDVTRGDIRLAGETVGGASSEQDRILKQLKQDYLVARRKGDWDAAAAIQDKMKQQKSFNSNLSRYDEESQKFADQTRQGFRHFADVTQATQVGGMQRNMNMALSRRGLQDSGIGQAMMVGANTSLAATTAKQVGGFEADLSSAMRQEREAFVRGEFDYMNKLNMMRYQTDLEMEMQAFQMQLQVDASKRDWFGQILSIGGSALMAYLNPVAGVASLAQHIPQGDSNTMSSNQPAYPGQPYG